MMKRRKMVIREESWCSGDVQSGNRGGGGGRGGAGGGGRKCAIGNERRKRRRTQKLGFERWRIMMRKMVEIVRFDY